MRCKNIEQPTFTNPLEWFAFVLVASHYPFAKINTHEFTLPSSNGSTTPDLVLFFSRRQPTVFIEVTQSVYLGPSLDPKLRQRSRGTAHTYEEGKDHSIYLVWYLQTLLTTGNIEHAIGIINRLLTNQLNNPQAQLELDKHALKTSIPEDTRGWYYDWNTRLYQYLTDTPIDHTTGLL